ncbi:MAG TPA: BolA family protein [Acidiphilium sp.]|nr:MAG: BolA family transcriptional regulator [Acidiphilium sp. 21-60-14]OYV91168.1 MAG: BolA family transcriptional regulator [Acidiphilium sp. 37-60-79]OZB39887.1 MAG: BolA family transcriptional regulator [Acidiphilium sp. 34-60-192]HQT87049.1 BolA family protein [Acidiphilium sp.]HQU22904.1 BolA family protein [Acidiphilium sp.]
MTTRTDRIRATLTESFSPTLLEIKDDSAKHANHATRMQQPGHAPNIGETHYRLSMISPVFTGMNRLARSRAVQDALKSEFDTGLHALSLTLKAPEEP